MTIGISFGGIEYRGADPVFCNFCKKPISSKINTYAWIIHENDSGRKVYLCDKHYHQWESRRNELMKTLSNQFKQELELIDKTDKATGTDKEIQAFQDFSRIIKEAKSIYEGYPAELDAIDYIYQRLNLLL